MDHTTWLLLTIWLMTGSFIGGVVTPLLAANKQVNEWLGMALGLGVGAVGHLVLLVPLWLLVWMQADRLAARPLWQRDAQSAADARRALERGAGAAPGIQLDALVAPLKANFWPAARAAGHSHRLTYVGVFAALAAITLVEVALTFLNLPFPVTGPLVALSTSKVALVALFFMHLRYDSRWYSALFALVFPFAALVVIVLALA